MSGKTNTTMGATLLEAGGDLQSLLSATESAIGGLVAAFQGLAEQTGSVSNLSAAIVDRVEDEGVRSVLPGAQNMGIAARKFVDERLQATAGILDIVKAEMELLHHLSIVTDGQAKIAFTIKMLNVNTKIEVAHLGSAGVIFEYLANELADFSQSLSGSTEELTSQTDDRRIAIDKTRIMLSVELPHLRKELARVETSLRSDVSVLDSGLTTLSMRPAQFRMSAEDIARQIAGAVVAVQGHDITRQQIEHVQEALILISDNLEVKEDSTASVSSQIARAHAGLEIQVYQLKSIRATIAEWTSQLKTCMDSIFRIGAFDLVEIGPLVLEQARLMSSQMSHIESLQTECQISSKGIRETLGGISQLSQLVTEHLQKSQSTRNRLRYLTFNSIIEASRLGTEADTICVIADGIAEVSAEWTNITEHSESALQEILSLSTRVNGVMATLSQTNSEELQEAQVEAQKGLGNLRSAAEFAVMQGEKIGVVTAAMQTRIGEVAKSSDLLDACFARIDAVLADLEEVKLLMENDHPGIREMYDKAEAESLYSASYTTEAERDVLRAAIYGTAIPLAQQSSTGNDVELF